MTFVGLPEGQWSILRNWEHCGPWNSATPSGWAPGPITISVEVDTPKDLLRVEELLAAS
jgi:hypothetical protein